MAVNWDFQNFLFFVLVLKHGSAILHPSRRGKSTYCWGIGMLHHVTGGISTFRLLDIVSLNIS